MEPGTPAAPNGVSEITLSDIPTLEQIGEAPTPNQPPTPEKKPEAPDPDKLILDLARRGQVLSGKEKGLNAREANLKAREVRVSQIDELVKLSQTDPYRAATEIASALGLDADALAEAMVLKKAGAAPRTLTPEERIERMEAEQRKREEDAKTQAEQRKTQDADQAVAGHISDLKGLAAADPTKFALFHRKGDEAAYAAFDLMVLHHNAGKPINHAKAVELVEAELRADAIANAEALGFKPSAPGTPTPNTPLPTPAAPPRPQTPPQTSSVAPIATSNGIKTDEEIAEDWRKSWGR